MALNAFRDLLIKKTSKAESFLWHEIGLVEQADSFGTTALHLAAGVKETGLAGPLQPYTVQAYQQLIGGMLAKGANPHALDKLGETPLFKACRILHFSVMKKLIEVTDVRLANSSGKTALEIFDVAYNVSAQSRKTEIQQVESEITSLQGGKHNARAYSMAVVKLNRLKLSADGELQEYCILRIELLIKQNQLNRQANPNQMIRIVDPVIGTISDLPLMRDYYKENFPINGLYDSAHIKIWLAQNANRYAAPPYQSAAALSVNAPVVSDEKRQHKTVIVFPETTAWQMFRKGMRDQFGSIEAQQGLLAARKSLATKSGFKR